MFRKLLAEMLVSIAMLVFIVLVAAIVWRCMMSAVMLASLAVLSEPVVFIFVLVRPESFFRIVAAALHIYFMILHFVRT